jgi:hypothetical protein
MIERSYACIGRQAWGIQESQTGECKAYSDLALTLGLILTSMLLQLLPTSLLRPAKDADFFGEDDFLFDPDSAEVRRIF